MSANRLGRVGKSFRHWRAKHGSGPGHPIPERMRERAIALLDEHAIDEVAEVLGLGTCTVRRWLEKHSMPKKRLQARKVRKSLEFIEVKGDSGSVLSPELVLEWVRPDGNRMRMTGVSVASSQEFINGFLCVGETR